MLVINRSHLLYQLYTTYHFIFIRVNSGLLPHGWRRSQSNDLWVTWVALYSGVTLGPTFSRVFLISWIVLAIAIRKDWNTQTGV